MNKTIAGRMFLALAAVLMAGGLAAAQGPGGGNPGMGHGFGQHQPPFERAFGAEGRGGQWWNYPHMVERLKLSDDQRTAMDGILLEHRTTLIDLHAGLEKAELQMEPLMGADQPNEGAILAQIDKVAQARAELEKANARFLLAIRSKLTPEQWKQLQADRANHGRDEHERGGWGRDPQKPGMNGPGGQYHHRQAPPAPDGQPGAPPPPAPGTGDEQ